MKYFRLLRQTLYFIKVLFLKYKSWRFHPNFLQLIINSLGLWDDPYRVNYTTLGEENKGKTVALIRFPKEWNPTAGFFALLNRMLCGLSFCDRMGYTPVADNWDGCPYEEDHPVNGTNIVFEYYFKPLSQVSLKSLMHSHNVVFVSNPNMDVVLHETQSEWFHLSDAYIKHMGKIYGKYIRLNDETEGKMESDISSILKNKKTLGIHFRGTDYKLNVNGHPVSLILEDYYPYIDKAMKTHRFDQIFLATDDISAMKKMKKRYKNVVLYEDNKRSDNDVSVAFSKSNEENYKYRLGYEVLRDSYTLARCDGLIAGYSQVSVGARINRASQKKGFSYCQIIDKGVNRNNFDWIKYYQDNLKDKE